MASGPLAEGGGRGESPCRGILGGRWKRKAQSPTNLFVSERLVGMSQEGDRFRAKNSLRQRTALRERAAPAG